MSAQIVSHVSPALGTRRRHEYHTSDGKADANQDGNVNALDVTKVELIIAGLD